MLEKVKLEGKNKEELLNKYLEEQKITLNEVIVQEQEIEAKIFKSKKYILDIVKKEDIKNFIKNYLKELSLKMNLEINSEIREKDETYSIILISDNNNILIGKDGKTLNSIQLLLHQSLSTQIGLNIRISVDISNYKDKKIKRLEREVKQIIEEVETTKIEVKLDPMNSYERRIVHTLVSEHEHLESESNGESPNRYVIIKYKD